MPDGVDTMMDTVQPPAVGPAADRAPRQADLEQLRAAGDPML
jgi:hypothetical protein